MKKLISILTFSLFILAINLELKATKHTISLNTEGGLYWGLLKVEIYGTPDSSYARDAVYYFHTYTPFQLFDGSWYNSSYSVESGSVYHAKSGSSGSVVVGCPPVEELSQVYRVTMQPPFNKDTKLANFQYELRASCGKINFLDVMVSNTHLDSDHNYITYDDEIIKPDSSRPLPHSWGGTCFFMYSDSKYTKFEYH